MQSILKSTENVGQSGALLIVQHSDSFCSLLVGFNLKGIFRIKRLYLDKQIYLCSIFKIPMLITCLSKVL